MADISNLFKATIKSINSRNKIFNENHSNATSPIQSKKQRGDFELKARNLFEAGTEEFERLQYKRLYLHCKQGVRFNPSMSKGDRQNLKTLKVGCKAKIGLSTEADDNGVKKLKVTACQLEHSNHPVGQEVKTITKLRDFLLENRKDYVNSGSLLSNTGSRMSESERDQIDNDAQQIIKNCKETIILFRVESDKQKVHPQVKEHRNAVMILIEAYLKAICKIYSEQKAVRVKRVVDKKKISKLEPERKHNSLTRQHLKKELNIDQGRTNHEKIEDEDNSSLEKTATTSKTDHTALQAHDFDHSSPLNDELTPEEMQMFEQENDALYQEMNSMSEEVRQIEGQVVEIAKLQEIFTEKILEQDVQIHNINNTVVGTTENIIDANEEIREAIRKKAEFRVWILFFLVVCSFSLLFLDWYNG